MEPTAELPAKDESSHTKTAEVIAVESWLEPTAWPHSFEEFVRRHGAELEWAGTGDEIPPVLWSESNSLLVELTPRELLVLKDRNFDDLEASAKSIAVIMGERVTLLDRARVLSELHAGQIQLEECIVDGEKKRTGVWNAPVVARRELISELAAVLHTSEYDSRQLIGETEMLVDFLPDTLAALKEGSISLENARVIANQARDVPEPERAEFERPLVPPAKELPPVKLRRKARDRRERLHPDSMAKLHKEAKEKRSITVEPASDGMMHLSAYLPAREGVGIFNRVTETAIALQGPTEDRSLGQLKADVFCDLLVNGTTEGPYNKGVQATVAVFVEVLTLLNKNNNPGNIAGYGPIDAETARQMAAEAPFLTRILVDPIDFTVLDVGTKRYTPTKGQRDFLVARDETCTFYGCNRAARYCDVDHNIEWQYGGHTNVENLSHLCPSHHALKTYSGWESSPRTDGAMVWISPTGRAVTSEPGMVIQPRTNTEADSAIAPAAAEDESLVVISHDDLQDRPDTDADSAGDASSEEEGDMPF